MIQKLKKMAATVGHCLKCFVRQFEYMEIGLLTLTRYDCMWNFDVLHIDLIDRYDGSLFMLERTYPGEWKLDICYMRYFVLKLRYA